MSGGNKTFFSLAIAHTYPLKLTENTLLPILNPINVRLCYVPVIPETMLFPIENINGVIQTL